MTNISSPGIVKRVTLQIRNEKDELIYVGNMYTPEVEIDNEKEYMSTVVWE